MTDKAISPLRRRLIEDMTIRRLSANTQHQYIRHVKNFADFVGRSLDKATAEDVHRYQLHLGSIGTTIPTVNAGASALRFFFKVTLKRRDLADAVVSVREPRRLPVVLSPEEVARLLASTTNIKHRAALSLTYATGLRRSEVVSLRLTDIDSDRMLIRVEQGKAKKDRYVILSPHLLELLREWWRRSPEGMDASGSALAVSRLPRAAHEPTPTAPARLLGIGTSRHHQACWGSYTAAQLRHPSPGAEDRYSDHPGFIGT